MKFLSLLLVPILCNTLYAASWQQQVDYKIHCRLDDQVHQLTADMMITYHNNSPQVLRQLKLHTWMNAFGPAPSPYSKQLDHLGNDSKLTLSSADQGSYRSLSFTQNYHALAYHFIDPSHEIVELDLNRPCLPGDSISFRVAYNLFIPKNISRGGHLGQSYQMTQWYPKVAIYDSSGWHTMPYLELGEFYNEFGNYDVTIDIPADYVVAATGMLTTPAEVKFLTDYADSCEKTGLNAFRYIFSGKSSASTKYKSITYSADQVIDFAWFADKHFLVNKKKITINDRSIQAWSFYYPKKITAWKQSVSYAENALNYFSTLVGTYPYPQVTLVECDRPGADGMEYPMITLIDRGYTTPPELEKVIVHEIGHNWFQAILATNERKDAWMDEGIVTYYEHRYAEKKGINAVLSMSPWTLNSDYDTINDFSWYLHAARNHDAASTNEATTYSTQGYVESIYEKPAKGLALLARSLGENRFDSVMQAYFGQWKFHHPHPEDLLNQFKSIGVDWLDILYLKNNSKVNVKVIADTASDRYLISTNLGYAIPVEVAGYYRAKKIYSSVIYASPDLPAIHIPNDSIQYLVLDPDFLLPETKRTDNILRIKPSAFAPKKTILHLLPGIGHSMVNDLYLNLIAGFNFYDGLMPGLVLHNLTLPSNALHFAGMFGYGLRSHKPVMIAGVEYSMFINSRALDRLTFSGEVRQFSYNVNDQYSFVDRYLKLAYKMKLSFKVPAQYSPKKEISYRTLFIRQANGYGINVNEHSYGFIHSSYFIHEFKYDRYQTKTLHPFEFNITADLGPGFRKVYSSYKISIPYPFGHNKSGELRLFAGLMHVRPGHDVLSDFFPNGTAGTGGYQRDYKFDELLLGRSEISNSLSQQVYEKDGALSSISHWIGSQNWMLALSYKTHIPGPFPLRPYIQTAVYPDQNKWQFLYTSGINLVVVKNILEVNFPIIESHHLPAIDQYGTHTTYLKRCTFIFNIKGLSPFKWIDRISD